MFTNNSLNVYFQIPRSFARVKVNLSKLLCKEIINTTQPCDFYPAYDNKSNFCLNTVVKVCYLYFDPINSLIFGNIHLPIF